ncbi:MAG: MOSC domain-containing protein [Pseudomonadota bacterium]
MNETLATLTARFPRPGQITWIGLRTERRAKMHIVERAELTEKGLQGDRARAGKRALSLIQAEHLPVIAALSGHAHLAPEVLRRNLVISGINLTAMRHRHARLGTAVIEITGPCAPCSRMEEALGPGGYNAMRGHGGMTARVIEPGVVAVGDTLETLPGGG